MSTSSVDLNLPNLSVSSFSSNPSQHFGSFGMASDPADLTPATTMAQTDAAPVITIPPDDAGGGPPVTIDAAAGDDGIVLANQSNPDGIDTMAQASDDIVINDIDSHLNDDGMVVDTGGDIENITVTDNNNAVFNSTDRVDGTDTGGGRGGGRI